MFKLWKTLPKRTRLRLANVWYDLLSRVDTGDDLIFMNHGYAPKVGAPNIADLPQELEKHRFPVQFYDYVASGVDWRGKDAVEVSSGRGGGASWLFDNYKPRSMCGIDLAASAVDFSTRTYARDGLSFQRGDAQALPLDDACCDILINIESSLNYPDQDAFLAEVDRVLKPGGYFLLADYRSAKGIAKLRRRLSAMNCEIILQEDISEEIARALELGDGHKREMLKQRVPWPLRPLVAAFSFTGDAAREEIAKFRDGRKQYLYTVLRKSA